MSVNNGRSFISSPITIYATTCVSSTPSSQTRLYKHACVCVTTWCGVFPAVRRVLGSLAPAGSAPAAGSGPGLVVLASVLHRGPSSDAFTVSSAEVTVCNQSYLTGDQRPPSLPASTSASCHRECFNPQLVFKTQQDFHWNAEQIFTFLHSRLTKQHCISPLNSQTVNAQQFMVLKNIYIRRKKESKRKKKGERLRCQRSKSIKVNVHHTLGFISL